MQAALLMKDGTITDLEGDLIFDLPMDSEFHFVIRHRNHLDILSANPVERKLYMNYSFNLQSKAYGPEALKYSGDNKWLMYAGDVNQDIVIQTTDYDEWFFNPSQVGVYNAVDMNLDGVIQVTDYDAWFLNKSKVAVPELGY